jgi:hypothetical protein
MQFAYDLAQFQTQRTNNNQSFSQLTGQNAGGEGDSSSEYEEEER